MGTCFLFLKCRKENLQAACKSISSIWIQSWEGRDDKTHCACANLSNLWRHPKIQSVWNTRILRYSQHTQAHQNIFHFWCLALKIGFSQEISFSCLQFLLCSFCFLSLLFSFLFLYFLLVFLSLVLSVFGCLHPSVSFLGILLSLATSLWLISL